MEYRQIAENILIPVLGLGTWGIGGQRTSDHSRDKEEVAAIKLGIDLGITHIDTAEMYGAGHAEELVGQAIKPYRRSDLFITTKVWHNHLKHDEVISAIKGSLKRLNTEYVDLYLIHWPNPQTPLKETMKVMEYCANEGYTRLVGVSNFPKPLLEEAQTYLKNQRIVADQVEYNLIEQDPRRELLPYCKQNGITVIAYRPLARGSLASLDHAVLHEIADKYGKTPAQVSLNWLISQENVVAIPKASKLEHLKDNIGALDWRLDKKDFTTLTETFQTTEDAG